MSNDSNDTPLIVTAGTCSTNNSWPNTTKERLYGSSDNIIGGKGNIGMKGENYKGKGAGESDGKDSNDSSSEDYKGRGPGKGRVSCMPRVLRREIDV